MTLRKSSPIALLAVIVSLLTPFHVDVVKAHCVETNGHIDHIAVGCNPTTSPIPTDGPSAPPTDSPTESPAPSPSPSEIPSGIPSNAPSTRPTGVPSEIPTSAPTSTPPSSVPSSSPTGPILLTLVGVELRIKNVVGEREMNLSEVKFFEKETTLYLQSEIERVPGVFKIEVENILVTNQTFVVVESDDTFISKDEFLRRRQLEQNQTDLIIIIDLVVSAIFYRSESADLDAFFEDFFKIPNNQNEFRAILEEKSSFAEGIFINSRIISSDASVKKGSNGTAVTATVLALVALVVGSGLLWMWIQARRTVDSQSSEPRKLDNLGTISKSYDSDDKSAEIPDKSKLFKINTSNGNDDNDNYERSSESSSQLMYIPTIMPTESNIDVPDTPGTAFGVNGFGTPANSNGFATPAYANGFATPSSTNGFATPASANGIGTPASASGFPTPASARSRGGGNDSHKIGGISKLLAPPTRLKTPVSSSQILKDISSSTSRKQKMPLPPNILGSIKSPFRRKQKNGDDDYYDRSSMFGAGVVAGVNNVSASDCKRKRTPKLDNNYSRALGGSRDLPPIEIGGPGITAVVKSTVVDAKGNRKNKSRSSKSRPPPPMVIGGPPDKYSTTNNDYGGVDIVDEIAYLYSTNSHHGRPEEGSI